MNTNDEKTIELKRVIMVKAIVTPDFKFNLVKELEKSVNNLNLQIETIDKQSESYIKMLSDSGRIDEISVLKHKLAEEKSRIMISKNELHDKINEAKNLQLGTEFIQGPLEGPVNVKVGDNLYAKVGAAEIIVKDGIIIDIKEL
ncbi:MAG: hypothetical protein KA792_07855 [Bacteroidales bacterium]|nr:hypothetical protein [Bacteroidales bacterium]